MAKGKIYENNKWDTFGEKNPAYKSGQFSVNLWGHSATGYYVKNGRLVTMRIWADFSSARTNFNMDPVGTLPAECRPELESRFTVTTFLDNNSWAGGTYATILMQISANGNINFYGNTTQNKRMWGLQVAVTYMSVE